MTDPRIPLTELSNPLSADLDLADPAGIVRIMAACDAELFHGPTGAEGVLAPTVVAAAARAVELLREALPGPIVLHGAGTSGRLAYLLARRHGPAVAALGGRLVPLIAGGDLALVKAQEAAEDQVVQGGDQVAAYLDPGPGALIGISCGLSAPCVAGGLERALQTPGVAAICFGTNRADRTRELVLDAEGRTFRDLVEGLDETGRGTCILPEVGPESLTGSTRLKGGSATWVVLDAVLAAVADRERRPEERITAALEAAAERAGSVYAQKGLLTDLVERGGRALDGGASILYLGGEDPGLAGMLDASECPPTFGATFNDVRAFLAGGWATVLGAGDRAANLESTWPLDPAYAWNTHLPGQDRASLPVLLGPPAGTENRLRQMGFEPVGVDLPDLFATKLALNVLTTGAHVIAGKVYGNRMVDLRISNSKLLDRAFRIIGHIAGVDREEARRSLVAVLHNRDEPDPVALELSTDQLVQQACRRERVVPLAILIAGGRVPLARARQALEQRPVVRQAIRSLLEG